MKMFLLISMVVCFRQIAWAQGVNSVRNQSWATKSDIGNIENLFMVDDSLYRSAQPSAKQMRALETGGFKTIINLRNIRKDDRKAKATTLRLIRVPINTWKMDYNDVLMALRAIRDNSGPALIHCIHGSDRTGAVVAAYRMVYQDWTRQDAITEFVDGGYGYHSGWFPGIVRLLEELDVEKLKSDLSK